MLIVLEDPSQTRSAVEKHQYLARISSYAAHAKHQMRKAHNPCARILPSRTPKELRSHDYYHQRTAQEWSGWNERVFWTSIAPRVASAYPALQCAIIALGAQHEYLDTGNQDLQNFSSSQARQCALWFNHNHQATPLSALLTLSILMTELATFLSGQSYLRCLKSEFALIDIPEEDAFDQKSLIKHHRSRICQLCDPLPLLREANIQSLEPIDRHFNNLTQARECLEKVLEMAAYETKAGVPVDSLPCQRWLDGLNELKGSSDRASWLSLKAAYSMSMIQIETMYSPTESIYDHYKDAYTQMITAFEATLAAKGPRTHVHFGVDAGFLRMLGWAGKWCRDPDLRSRIIVLLRTSRSFGGGEASWVWTDTIETLQSIEEAGIIPAPCSSTDIAERRRVRLYGMAFCYKAGLHRIDFLRYPYISPPKSVWIRYTSKYSSQVMDNAEEAHGLRADFVFGPAYLEIPETDGSHFSVRSPDFYFVIPKV